MKKTIVSVAACLLFLAGPASASGVRWHKGDLPAAMAAAKKANKRLVVKFTAAWCSVCKVLKKKVLDTAEGRRLTKDMLAVQVDFDAPQNRKYVEKYVVLGLPTTVVLKANGAEAGRIMGFENKASWVTALTELKKGEVSLASLEKQHAKFPQDPSAMRLLGQALLQRGSPARGQALLERVTWLAPESDAAAHALFVLGRYFHRVKEDPETARHIWRELASRFPASDWAPGAWWWYARAQAEIGRPLTGAYSLEMWAQHAKTTERKLRATRLWGKFVVKHKLKALAPKVLRAFKAVEQMAGSKEKKKMDALVPKLKGLK